MKRVHTIGIAASSAAVLVIGGLAASSVASDSHAQGNVVTLDSSRLFGPESPTNVFVAVASCRVANTTVAGGKIGANRYRSFLVRGATGFPGQGGKPGGCGIPASAVAVAASLTAGGETGTGTLTAYAHGASAPKTTMLSYHEGVNITSGATVRLASSGVPHLRVFNRSASTHLAIDVMGYYVPQIHAVISPAGAVVGASKRVVTGTHLGTGYYRVRIDRDLTGCAPTATVQHGAYFATAFEDGPYVFVRTYGFSGGSPVQADVYWALTVTC